MLGMGKDSVSIFFNFDFTDYAQDLSNNQWIQKLMIMYIHIYPLLSYTGWEERCFGGYVKFLTSLLTETEKL